MVEMLQGLKIATSCHLYLIMVVFNKSHPDLTGFLVTYTSQEEAKHLNKKVSQKEKTMLFQISSGDFIPGSQPTGVFALPNPNLHALFLPDKIPSKWRLQHLHQVWSHPKMAGTWWPVTTQPPSFCSSKSLTGLFIKTFIPPASIHPSGRFVCHGATDLLRWLKAKCFGDLGDKLQLFWMGYIWRCCW